MSKRRTADRTVQPSSRRFPLWPVIAAVVVLAAAVIAIVAFAQNSATVQALPPEISVKEAAARREAGAFILDVRQPDEWADFHIPDAHLIPLGELQSRVNEVPRDKDVVMVCRSGNRSKSGRDILLKAGYTRVTSMSSGLTEWKAEGLPVQSGS